MADAYYFGCFGDLIDASQSHNTEHTLLLFSPTKTEPTLTYIHVSLTLLILTITKTNNDQSECGSARFLVDWSRTRFYRSVSPSYAQLNSTQLWHKVGLSLIHI